MHSLKIDEGLCTGCRECVDSCFVDAIRWDESKGIPICAYPEDCQVCFVCERICPARALEVIPDWKSKYNPRTIAKDRR